MKKTNEQFEKNIARLVKLTGDSQNPSEHFTDTLIESALRELPQAQPRRQRSTRMKSFTKNLLKIAAVFVIVGGLVSLITMPTLKKVKKYSSTQEYQRTDKPIETRDVKKYEVALVTSSPQPVSQQVAPKAMPLRMKLPLEDSLNGSPMAHGGTTPPNGEPVDAMFFKNYGVNPFIDTDDDHLSTFAIDVDTASYTLCRSYLLEGNLPSRDAVRVEEFVNYFDYDYPAPEEDTFAVFYEAMPWSLSPDRQNTYLMRIGLKALQIPDQSRKPAVLTFVIDVSGSMNRENRLGLVKQSLHLLIDKLRPDDKIGIAVYGSRGHAVLSHTSLAHRDAILEAIDALQSEGSTYAEEGIRIGYEMAQTAYVPGCINRVILCSDGVANVGQTGADQILKIIKEKADNGITLSSLGFGMGNYNDILLEQLGDKGNGYYAYIDTLDQARRLFSNLTGALQVVARDVKIQVDFNPDVVRSYRLIGYENRDVADQDFRNDTVDGGEIGAGHATTALYELKLWPEKAGQLATTSIRYKDPDTDEVTEISARFDTPQIATGPDSISDSFALSSVVTEFAEILRESYWVKGADLSATLARAEQYCQKYPQNADAAELKDLIARAVRLLQAKNQQQQPDTPTSDLIPADIEYQKQP